MSDDDRDDWDDDWCDIDEESIVLFEEQYRRKLGDLYQLSATSDGEITLSVLPKNWASSRLAKFKQDASELRRQLRRLERDEEELNGIIDRINAALKRLRERGIKYTVTVTAGKFHTKEVGDAPEVSASGSYCAEQLALPLDRAKRRQRVKLTRTPDSDDDGAAPGKQDGARRKLVHRGKFIFSTVPTDKQPDGMDE